MRQDPKPSSWRQSILHSKIAAAVIYVFSLFVIFYWTATSLDEFLVLPLLLVVPFLFCGLVGALFAAKIRPIRTSSRLLLRGFLVGTVLVAVFVVPRVNPQFGVAMPTSLHDLIYYPTNTLLNLFGVVALAALAVGMASRSAEFLGDRELTSRIRSFASKQLLLVQRQTLAIPLEGLLTELEAAVIGQIIAASPRVGGSGALRRDIETKILILRLLDTTGASTRYQIQRSLGSSISVDTVYRQCQELASIGHVRVVEQTTEKQVRMYEITERGRAFKNDFDETVGALKRKYPEITQT